MEAYKASDLFLWVTCTLSMCCCTVRDRLAHYTFHQNVKMGARITLNKYCIGLVSSSLYLFLKYNSQVSIVIRGNKMSILQISLERKKKKKDIQYLTFCIPFISFGYIEICFHTLIVMVIWSKDYNFCCMSCNSLLLVVQQN